MNKNKKNIYVYLLIFSVFFFHLISINFHPTNFEGGYGAFANFFDYENKVLFLTAYYNSQFNTYIFSGLGSIINNFVPFIDGYHSMKLLSASSYFFLCFGILNILKFYNYKNDKILFILIVFFNSIIWNYGFRAFNDLFAFSLAIFFFSKILTSTKMWNFYINSFLLGITMIIKSYNLIFLIPLYFLFFYENKKKKLSFKVIKTTILILLPFIIYNLVIYRYLGFFFAPKSEDLQIALIGGNPNRDIFWILNNFIFYIGYLTLISFPFSIIFFIKSINKFTKNTLINFILIIFLSIFLQKFFFISSELDLGPLQKFISDSLYKTIIIINFLFFIYLVNNFIKFKTFDKKKFDILLIIIFTILCYLLALSFIKASQRYLILPIPFFFLFLFSVSQPRILIFIMIIIYSFFNSLLLANYYVTSKSTEMILSYLKKENILENTLPGVITPHIYHLYDNCENFEHTKKCSGYINDTVKLTSSDFKVVNYSSVSMFSPKVSLLGIEFMKFSVIRINK